MWIGLNPQRGREQAGRRPVLVLSNSRYNALTGLLVGCPVTSRVKGYPSEVSLPEGLIVTGAVLADQIRTLDWRERGFDRIELAPPETVRQALRLLARLLEFAP